MEEIKCSYCGGSGKEQYESSRIGYDKIKELMVKSNVPCGIENKDDIIILGINKL